MFINIPTGFGKSLIYQALPLTAVRRDYSSFWSHCSSVLLAFFDGKATVILTFVSVVDLSSGAGFEGVEVGRFGRGEYGSSA